MDKYFGSEILLIKGGRGKTLVFCAKLNFWSERWWGNGENLFKYRTVMVFVFKFYINIQTSNYEDRGWILENSCTREKYTLRVTWFEERLPCHFQ